MWQMKDSGYWVAGTGKVMHTSRRGTDRPQMEAMHDQFHQSVLQRKLPAGRMAAATATGTTLADDQNVAWATDLLREWDGNGPPLFLSVGILRPHRPFLVPQKYFDLYDRNSILVPDDDAEDDLTDVSFFYRLYRLVEGYVRYLQNNDFEREFIHGYMASLSYSDAKIGEIMQAIDDNPALADARILLWSDNGYELGDKDTWNKFTIWESSSRVPLIMVDPTLPSGISIGTPTSLLDVAPTVLEWAGVDAPPQMDGVSLLDVVHNRRDYLNRTVLTTMNGSCSIRRRDLRFNLYTDGTYGLYHMKNDPLQKNNLAYSAAWQDTVTSLLDATVREVRRQGGQIDPLASSVVGTANNDTLYVFGSQNAYGSTGDDTYFISGGNVIEQAEEGEDLIMFAASSINLPKNVERAISNPFLNVPLLQRLTGQTGWRVVGSSGPDSVRLYGGAGHISAGAGDDVLKGVGGRDVFQGGTGRDYLDGGNNNDQLYGDAGADQLFGGAGNDYLVGGQGMDLLTGGLGNDLFAFPSDTVRDEVLDFQFPIDRILLGPSTPLNGMSESSLESHLIAIPEGVLIRDSDGRKMLIRDASVSDVLRSFYHE